MISCLFKKFRGFKVEGLILWRWLFDVVVSCQAVFDSFETPWTVARQVPLCPWDLPYKSIVMGCHFLLQGHLLTQGLNPALAGRFFATEPLRKPKLEIIGGL